MPPRFDLLARSRSLWAQVRHDHRWTTPLAVAFGSRCALYILLIVFVGLFPGEPEKKPTFWQALSQWDGAWYLRIATEGYVWQGPTTQSAVPFFPFYPLVSRAVGFLVGDLHWGFLLVTNISFVLFLLYLYWLTLLDFDAATAERAIVYAAIFPGAFVLGVFYTEATAFALSVASFYYARCGRWRLAIGLGFCAALARPLGAAIVLPLLYEYWRQHGLRPQVVSLGIVPLGLLGYGAYVGLLSGDPWTLVTIQHTAWFRNFTLPWDTIAMALDRALWPHTHYVVAVSFLDLGAILLFIGLTIYLLLRMPPSYWLYALPIILVSLSSTVIPEKAPPTSSISRYLMAIFPGYIALARLAHNPFLDQTLRWTFALLMGIFAMYFFSFFWVL